MAVQINLVGLNSDRYLFNNPIWLDVTGLGVGAVRLVVTISRTDISSAITASFYIYAGIVSFDISEYIKGMCEYPDLQDGLLSGDPIQTNYYPFNINFSSLNASNDQLGSLSLNKTFIRGGLENQNTNISLPEGTYLKESVAIPTWIGYTTRIYKIENNTIIMSTDTSGLQTIAIPIKSCNPVFVRFMNMLGGYSYWLFENWSVTKKTDKTQIIDRRYKDISTGNKSSYTFNVESRIDRTYFKLIRALIQSPEVSVLGLSDKINEVSGFVQPAPQWEQIWNQGNTSSIDALQKLNNVKLKFDYVVTMKTETIW